MFIPVFLRVPHAPARSRSLTGSRPPAPSRPAGLYLIKAIFLMSLALGLLAARPAHAQGGWTVTDQVGNALSTNPSGGYDLRGPMTGTYQLDHVYQDMLNASIYAFAPNPSS